MTVHYHPIIPKSTRPNWAYIHDQNWIPLPLQWKTPTPEPQKQKCNLRNDNDATHYRSPRKLTLPRTNRLMGCGRSGRRSSGPIVWIVTRDISRPESEGQCGQRVERLTCSERTIASMNPD